MPTTIHLTDNGQQSITGIKDFNNILNINSGSNINNNLLYYSNPSGFFSGVGVTGSGDGGFFLGKNKIFQNTLILKNESLNKNFSRIKGFSGSAIRKVAISSDGKYQTAIVNFGINSYKFYISNDYGNNWRVIDGYINNWIDVAMSSDGKYQTAINLTSSPYYNIYVSNDYGNTWILKATSVQSCTRIALSSNGKTQIISRYSSSLAYSISNDYGNTWTDGQDLGNGCSSPAISSDGKYILLPSASSTNKIFVSNNYGQSFNEYGPSSVGFGSAAMSSNGQYQIVGANNGYIYVSSNYGINWTQKTSFTYIGPKGWNAISMSSDGKYIAASTVFSYIYVSYDYGQTWLEKTDTSSFWKSIEISSNGKYIIATNGNNIYFHKADEQIDGDFYVDNFYAVTGSFSGSNLFLGTSGTVGGTTISMADQLSTSYNTINWNDGILAFTDSNQQSASFTFDYPNTNNISLNIDFGEVFSSERFTDLYIPKNKNGTIAIDSELVHNTGDENIAGVKIFTNSGIFSLSEASPLSLPNNPLSIVGSGNSYLQLNIQNRATGTDASADLVITANNGTDSSNYINLGINNLGYNNASYNNATGYDGYLFIDGGDLDIGTRTPGKIVEFHAGGTIESKVIARISESGLNIVSGNLTVNNTGVLLSGQSSFVLQGGTNQSTTSINANYVGLAGANIGWANTINSRRTVITENCIAKKASITLQQGTAQTPVSNITGALINVTKNLTGIISTTMNTTSDDNFYNFYNTGLNVPFSIGDSGVVLIHNPSTINNVRCLVNVHFYYN